MASAFFSTAAGLQSYLACLRGEFPRTAPHPDRDEPRLHFAVADYPSLASTKIGDRNTNRCLQSKDRFAWPKKHDAGGLEC
jgi:hypothetical protein